MGLPDPDSARTWGGKLLVDRDGAEIGACTQILLDDATGKPEWATADVESGTAFVPLMDAVESGTQVRVVVRRADVAEAPSVADAHHLSEDEEERLYRHYGIDYSRAASQSQLPVGDAQASTAPVTPAAPAAAAAAPTPAAAVAGEPAEVTTSSQYETDATDAAAATTPGTSQARRVLVLAAGAVVALGAIVGASLRWRRRPQPPLTRPERLAARARSASRMLEARRRQAVASTAPVLQASRRLLVVGAQQAAMQAAAAAERASTLSALAKAAHLPGASQADDVVDQAPTAARKGTQRRIKAAGALKTAVSFGAGYLLGSRAGRTRLDQVKRATTTWAQRPGVQQTRDRLRAGDKLQAGMGRVTHRAAGVTGKLRPGRSTSTGPVSGAEPPPEAALIQDSPSASGDVDGEPGADRLR